MSDEYGTLLQGAATSGDISFRHDEIYLNYADIAKFAQSCANFSAVLGKILDFGGELAGTRLTKLGQTGGAGVLNNAYEAATTSLITAIENCKEDIDDTLQAIIAAARAYQRTDQNSTENFPGDFRALAQDNAFDHMTNLPHGPTNFSRIPSMPSSLGGDANLAQEAGDAQHEVWSRGIIPHSAATAGRGGASPRRQANAPAEVNDGLSDRTADLDYQAGDHNGIGKADQNVQAAATVADAGPRLPDDPASLHSRLDNPSYWGTFECRLPIWARFKNDTAGGDLQAQAISDMWNAIANNLDQGHEDLFTNLSVLQNKMAWTGQGGQGVAQTITQYLGNITQQLIPNVRAVAGSYRHTSAWLGKFHNVMPPDQFKGSDPNGDRYANNPPHYCKPDEPYYHFSPGDADPDSAPFISRFDNVYNLGVSQSLSSIPSSFGFDSQPSINPADLTLPTQTGPTGPTGPGEDGGGKTGGGAGAGGFTVPTGSVPTTGANDPAAQAAMAQGNAGQAGADGLQALQNLLGQGGNQQSAADQGAGQSAADQGAGQSDTGAGQSDTGSGQGTANQGLGAGGQAAQQAAQQLANMVTPQGLSPALNAVNQAGRSAKDAKKPATLAGIGGGGGGGGIGDPEAASPTQSLTQFPRATLTTDQQETATATQTAEAEAEEAAVAGRAGAAPMTGMPGMGAANAGQQKERKRADYLDSTKHLDKEFTEPDAVLPIVGYDNE